MAKVKETSKEVKKETKNDEKNKDNEVLDEKTSIDDRLAKAKAYLRHVQTSNKRKKGSDFVLGFAKDVLKAGEKIPTGISSADVILNGGIPKGRVVVIYGEKSVSKTNFLYKLQMSCIEHDLLVSRFDIEQQDSIEWLNKIGLDTSKFISSNENRFEVVWDSIKEQIDMDAADVFIVDSLDTMLHKDVDEQSADKSHMALTARKMSMVVFPQLLHRLSSTGKTLIIVAQKRTNLNISGPSYDLTTYSGGNALKHNSSLDIWFRRTGRSSLRADGGRFKNNNETIGFSATAKITKSKIYGVKENSDFKYDFFYNRGIDNLSSLFEFAWELKMLSISGPKYSILDKNNNEIVSDIGYEKIYEKIESSKEIRDKLLLGIKEKWEEII